MTPEMLVGRKAKCSCGATADSHPTNIAFFEFCGEGSEAATAKCKHCGYFECAHTQEGLASKGIKNSTVIERGLCNGFEPHGPWEYDRFYCGCRGWD